MAVNVDTVYKTVLYILNKEQRGYMTPDEFNKVGQQVQLEIFEAYFEELNQLQRQPQTNTEFSDRVQQIQNKIATFEVEDAATFDETGFFYLPSNLHRLGEIYYNGTTIVQPVQQNEYLLINKSPLTSPTLSQPIYVQRGEHTSAVGPPPVLHDKIFVYPTTIKEDSIKCSYVKTPAQVNWAFTVNVLGAYIFTTTGAQNFELDVSEQTEIILKILQYSGIIIRDPQIVQTAAQLVAQDTVNEKS